jgi:hypothetical protein
MMSKNIFIQIAMIAISVGIILTFVEPTFSKIGELQDDIVVYQTEQQKVSGVNAQLASLINTLDNIAPDDQRRLLAYMPDDVDTINVVRDLSLISENAGVEYISAVASGEGVPADEREVEVVSDFVEPKEYIFTLSVEGAYDQIKNLFMLLEQNNYPLEVKTVSVQKAESGLLAAEITMSAYAHAAESDLNQEIEF